jgi:hypothetical protein
LWRGLDVQLSEKKGLNREALLMRKTSPRWLGALLLVNCCGFSHYSRLYHGAWLARLAPLKLLKTHPILPCLEVCLPPAKRAE